MQRLEFITNRSVIHFTFLLSPRRVARKKVGTHEAGVPHLRGSDKATPRLFIVVVWHLLEVVLPLLQSFERTLP